LCRLSVKFDDLTSRNSARSSGVTARRSIGAHKIQCEALELEPEIGENYSHYRRSIHIRGARIEDHFTNIHQSMTSNPIAVSIQNASSPMANARGWPEKQRPQGRAVHDSRAKTPEQRSHYAHKQE